MLAHYYNSARQWKKGVVLTYKRQFLEPDQAVEDFERSGMDTIRLSSKWQTDDKIAVNGWCYVENTRFWPVDYLIGALADIVSKNGNLLLNVGPKPDGTLREVEVKTLKEIGAWLKINGEAIYGTRPWREFGEGTMVEMKGYGKAVKHKMGRDCVRFTVKDNVLYAICFGRPNSGNLTIKSLSSRTPVSLRGIRSVSMLGSDKPIEWNETEKGLELVLPVEAPCDYAFVLKIVPKGKLLFEKE
jgi:alpha-L-fucosidase